MIKKGGQKTKRGPVSAMDFYKSIGAKIDPDLDPNFGKKNDEKLTEVESEIVKNLLGGDDQKKENERLLKIIEEQAAEIEALANENEKLKTTKKGNKKSLTEYSIINIKKALRLSEVKLINPEVYSYDEGMTAYIKNNKKFYDYQRNFISDWSVSAQELVFLYYGVGTGKSMIACNCAELFLELNSKSKVYFLLPASLVLDMIIKMFQYGIDPTRKDESGEYVYNFFSYQQCLRSSANFDDKSLLIVDEAHNLRNLKSVAINEKVSARKWEKTGDYSLVGSKLAQILLESDNKFLRTIFMSGTLFVNSPEDIEALISIGFKKEPKTHFKQTEWDLMLKSFDRFQYYFDGLISYYKKPGDAVNFPRTIYHFVLVPNLVNPIKEGEKFESQIKKSTQRKKKVEKINLEEFGGGARGDKPIDAFYHDSRNADNIAKSAWVIDFILKHKDEKTLIYSQFLGLSVKPIEQALLKFKIPYVIITGELTNSQKIKQVSLYNSGAVKVCLYSFAIKEGISFKETNNFICVQPYWNYAMMEQITARGIRSDSHKNGNKSTVNCYMLIGGAANTEQNRFAAKTFSDIFNSDIKNFKVAIDEKGNDVPNASKQYSGISRDFDMYSRMLQKQLKINRFEEWLFRCKRFEEANNIENNPFIKSFNAAVIIAEEESGNIMTLKDKMALKSKMYEEYYAKKIMELNTSSGMIRFEDSKFKKNRNPNLEEKANNTKYANKIAEIKEMLDSGNSLSDILNLFKLPKSEITAFQANFTPIEEVMQIIDQSGIANDTRAQINVLEPTAGIGNVIAKLLLLDNNKNMMINSVELHNLFFQISAARFLGIDNVHLYNADFITFDTPLTYDYILGNPPFNLRTQVDTVVFIVDPATKTKTDKVKKVDTVWYDVDFVMKCYNMLNDRGGQLTMIISSRFLREKSIKSYEVFNEYLDMLKKIKPDAVLITEVKGFKGDETINKQMETNYGMVCITLKKVKKFLMFKGERKKAWNEKDDE
jgi:phospholipid N-methyltransferase